MELKLESKQDKLTHTLTHTHTHTHKQICIFTTTSPQTNTKTQYKVTSHKHNTQLPPVKNLPSWNSSSPSSSKPMPQSLTLCASNCGLTKLSSVDHSLHNCHPNRRRNTTTALCLAHRLPNSTICIGTAVLSTNFTWSNKHSTLPSPNDPTLPHPCCYLHIARYYQNTLQRRCICMHYIFSTSNRWHDLLPKKQLLCTYQFVTSTVPPCPLSGQHPLNFSIFGSPLPQFQKAVQMPHM